MTNFVHSFIARWTPQPFAVRIFRLLVGSALLLMYVDRHKDVSFFYGSESFSLLPEKSWSSVWLESQRPSWFWFVPDVFLPYLHGAYLILIILYMGSWTNRYLVLLTWLMHWYFLLRNPMVWFGADLVANLWLMYSVFLPHATNDSITQWLARLMQKIQALMTKQGGFGEKLLNQNPQAMGLWLVKNEDGGANGITLIGVLLIVTHLMIIYFYTGLEKLRGHFWWDGTALWYALANSQMVVWDITGWIVQGGYWLIPVLSWMTVCFEIFFPLALFLPQPWPWLFVGFGLLFHATIGLLMALLPFSLLMMAPYVFFAAFLRKMIPQNISPKRGNKGERLI